MRKLLMLAVIVMAISGCTGSNEESFDSSVETTVPRPDEVLPDIPATVAAAFTATAESAPTPTSTPHPPYLPQFSDYLMVVDELAQNPLANDGFGRTKRFKTSAYSLFDVVAAMYWLDVKLGTEPESRSGFITFGLKSIYIVCCGPHVRDAAQKLLQRLAALAINEPHPASVHALVWTPSGEEIFLICTVGVHAHPNLSPYQEYLFPPAPFCPVLVAEYQAYGKDYEFGFLGYMSERFVLELFPDHEPVEPLPTFAPLPTLVPSPAN